MSEHSAFDLDACLALRTVGSELPRLQAWAERRIAKGVLPEGAVIVPLRPLDEEYHPREPQFTYRLPGKDAAMCVIFGNRTHED